MLNEKENWKGRGFFKVEGNTPKITLFGIQIFYSKSYNFFDSNQITLKTNLDDIYDGNSAFCLTIFKNNKVRTF